MEVRRQFPISGVEGAAVTPRRVLGAARRPLRSAFGFFTALILTLGVTNIAAQSLSPDQQIQGDFNGDRRLDALLQPTDATGQVQIILADGASNLTIPGQTWSADYLGLHWSADTSRVVVGDFAGNDRGDVLLQPLQSGGTGAVLLADPSGQFHAVTQLIANPYMGLDWSAASHTLVIGDFTGNGLDDVLLQTATPGGMNLIAQPNAEGVFNTTGQSWPDGYLGLLWSAQQVTLYTGDFSGNGRSDLLVQVNDPVSDTEVPAYALLLANGNGEFTQINQSWGVNAFGADWSPTTHALSIQDVTGSGVDAIVLMAKDPNGTNYLFLGNQTGVFSKPDLMWTGTQTAKAAWTAKMASQASISVTATTSSSSAKTRAASIPQAHVAAALLNPVNAVGDMGGQSGVNGGAATYGIPIVVPPGRAGMQPSLSLNYSSRGGNGDLGMGWSLSGLSAVTRCPATKAQDGYTQGVTYSATYDRLCLDGQHLIAVTCTYGSNGSVYRTELDSLVRVTLTGGSINSSAASFKVDYEDGRIAYYGTGAGTNTQFIASGASYPLVWAIAKEVDASGNNSIVYNYNAYGSGEYHIASIVYSGTANREVDFTYTSRGDPSSVWLAGGLTRQTRLLSQVTTKVAGSVVGQYSLNYSLSNATGRSLLQSVQECGYALGSSSLSCLPPDSFTWQNAPLSYAARVKLDVPSVIATESGTDFSDPGAGNKQSYVSIDKDFDGDGQRELYYVNNVSGAEDIFWLKTPGIYIDARSFFSNGFRGLDEDFLSNGLADLIGDKDGQVAVAWCTNQIVCTSALDFTTTLTGIPYHASVATGQFTGDGLPDIAVDKIVSSTSRAIYLYPNISTNPGSAPVFDTAPINLAPLASFGCLFGTQYQAFTPFGDLDGNGIPDLMITQDCETNSAPAAVAFVHNTSGTAGGSSATVKSLSGIGINLAASPRDIYYFADINGDGLKDFVFDGADGNWQYQINKGGSFGPVVDTGFFAGNIVGSLAGFITNFGSIKVGDFTNEGKDELLVPVSRKSTYCLPIKGTQEGVLVPEWFCGDQLDNKGYLWADHSIYNFQILKFVEQVNGSYAPGWVSSGGIPVSLAAEGGTVDAGDLYGRGLTDIFMLSSKWFNVAAFNISEVIGCTPGSPPCAPAPAQGYYTISPNGGAPDLMLSATNGLSAQASWTYDSLTDLKQTGAYKVDRPCSTAPNTPGQPVEYYCFTSSMWVVNSYSVSNDSGSSNNYTYGYADAVYENQGRGFQGFKSITVNFNPHDDSQDATTTVRSYHQNSPLSGQLISETVTAAATGKLLSRTDNTWRSRSPGVCLQSTKVFWPQLVQSVVTRNGTNNDQISKTTTNYTYDGYGNTTQVAASTVDSTGTYGTTTNYLSNSPDCTNWWWSAPGFSD